MNKLENFDFERSTPVKPIAPWIGGKARLAKTIISHIMDIPHKTYAEPFVGMGGVFLRRPYRAKAEFINDYSKDVTNLFRVVQRHKEALIAALRWQFTSRADFNRLMAVPVETLTDIERAGRFLCLQRMAFGGKPIGRTYGVAAEDGARFNTVKLIPLLEILHDRLASVTIECLQYGEFIQRYDKPNTLFYLDPPYYNCENYYGKDMFNRGDFTLLAEQLKEIKGKFILSLNDHPDVRKIFDQFSIKEVSIKYSVSSAVKDREFGELLISNTKPW